jgi:cell division protein FtsQ
LFWTGLAAYYVATMSYVADYRSEKPCTSVKVDILDSNRIHFITEDDILRIVDVSRIKLRGKTMDSINTADIETRLMQVQPVHCAEAYKTSDGTVHVEIKQRIPLLRIINRFGESYYIDETGYVIKHNHRYNVHVLVANGHIEQRSPAQKGFYVQDIRIPEGKRNIVRELFDLAVWIGNNRFWNAQIQQIYVNTDGDFEMIPRVGSQVIIFGKGDHIREKFDKLEALYRNGFNVTGWNKYDIINLKYDGQIVCTKRD